MYGTLLIQINQKNLRAFLAMKTAENFHYLRTKYIQNTILISTYCN
jgi:hypothetical protein